MIKTTELIQELMRTHHLSKSEAEKFVNLLFEVLNNGLDKDRLVKVKGLGSFKVASVSARESIDVNTGERIVIEGRNKISFTPEAALRGYVNRPFAQFETVIVNEGANIEELSSEEADATGATSDSSKIKSFSKATTEEVSKASIEDEKPSEKQEKSKEDTTLRKEYIAPSIEVQRVDSKPVEEVRAEEHSSVEAEVCTAEVERESISEVLAPHTGEQDAYFSQEPEQIANGTRYFKRVTAFLSIACCLLICLCIGGLYLAYKEISQRNEKIDSLIAQIHQERQHVPSLSTTTQVASSHTGKQETLSGRKIASAAVEKEDDQAIKKTMVTEPSPVEHAVEVKKPQEVDYSMLNRADVRVRTGAYKITGVKTIVKVKKGQTLQSISRSYLGPDMECYVEVLNGKKAANIGDSLKIPSLSLKHKR